MKHLTESELRRLAGLPEAHTKVKDKVDLDWDTMFDEPVNHAVTARAPDAKSDAPVGDIKLKRASAADTARATANITPTDAMRDTLAKLDRSQFDAHDDDQIDEPTPPDTSVPAMISKAIAQTGSVSPEWHTVSNLPGNADRVIRQLGKQLFGAFTRTPTDDITVIANLGGRGPNTTQEVNSVAAWIVKHGRKVDSAKIDFSQIMPGYTAQTEHYSAGGVRFELVKDEYGQYIYAWPESDSLDNVEQVGHGTTPRLK